MSETSTEQDTKEPVVVPVVEPDPEAYSEANGGNRGANGGKDGEVAATDTSKDASKQDDDNKNTCCCIFVNFPLLGVWGLFWTFLWPIFALIVMIIYAVSLDSMQNCFKPSFLDGGLSSIFNLLLALLCIAIIVTGVLYFYDMYLFRCFAKELPEMYVKARRGALTNLLPDDRGQLRSGQEVPRPGQKDDIELAKLGYMEVGSPDNEASKRTETQSDDPKDGEKAKNPDLPTSPVGCLGKMIAYCEWKFYRVKRIPGLSFYHVQGGFELVLSDILSLAIVVSVSVGVAFVNVSGLLVLIKSITSIVVRHLVSDLFCTNFNMVKKTLSCCGLPRKCMDCLKKSCDCLKKCKCDCLKKCKCDCLKKCKCKCDCLKKCKLDCCSRDIDCRHFKLRCRNISYQNAKKKASDVKRDLTVPKFKDCLISSPLCTAVSLALLVSTVVLAACCAVHTVGANAWTLGGGVSNLELHPSFPVVQGVSHFSLTLNSTACDSFQPVSIIPFQGSSSYMLPSCAAGGTSMDFQKKLFRMGAKVYLQVDAMVSGCEATLFMSEVNLLPCLGIPGCKVPVVNTSVDFCGFQGNVFNEFALASLRVCSLV